MPYAKSEEQRAAQKRHYEANKQRYRDAVVRNRGKKQAVLNELKSAPCTDCNTKFNPWQMHFDHIGTDKVADVSKLLRTASMETILLEVAKCEVVCANCHANRTYKRLVENGQ